MASLSIRKMADKLVRTEERDKRAKIRNKLTSEKVIGSATALATAAAAGYANGKLDILGTDQTKGDGLTLMGVPVVPVVGVAAFAGGIMFKGQGASLASYGGLGLLCYSVGRFAEKKGGE